MTNEQKATLFTAMEQTMADWILCLNLNRLASDCPKAADLFAAGAHFLTDALFVSDGQTEAAGGEIADLFASLEDRRKAGVEDFILITASPAYRAETAECGRVSVDTDVYVRGTQDGNEVCTLHMMRMEAALSLGSDGRARFTDLVWYTIQVMVPWTYAGTEPWLPAITRGNLYTGVKADENADAAGQVICAPQDYTQIEALCNKPWDRLLQKSDDLFADAGVLQVLKDAFPSEKAQKPVVITSGMPSMAMSEDGKTAAATTVIETFEVWSSDHFAGTDELVRRRFFICRFGVTRTDKGWIISEAVLDPLLCLPDIPYIKGKRFDMASGSTKLTEWTLANPGLTGAHPEDRYAIETVLNQWVVDLRRGDLTHFPMTYMNHPDLLPLMNINSQGNKAEPEAGLDTITARTSRMDRLARPRMLSYHTCTTPVIEINEAGDFAVGTWYDHSKTNMFSANMFDPEKGMTLIPYMVFIARYRHEFKKLDGQWYMSNFYWEPIIDMSEWYFDIVHTHGWVCREPWEQYKNAFDVPDFAGVKTADMQAVAANLV